MRNVEFKARLTDPDRAEQICRELGAKHTGQLSQRDTYFRVARGRLKRRETDGELTEWIEYFRPDRDDARNSDYSVMTPRQAAERFDVEALRQLVVVQKRRELFWSGRVRIHLDRVVGLGDFLEFEALVDAAQTQDQAERALEQLRRRVKSCLGPPVAHSYSDLLLERSPGRTSPS